MRGASHSSQTVSSAESSAARATARASESAPTPSTSAAGRVRSRIATGSTPSTLAAVSGQSRRPRRTRPLRIGTRSALWPSGMRTSKVQSARTCSANGSGGGRSPSKYLRGAPTVVTSARRRVERGVLSIDPASVIRGILDLERLLRDLEGAKGIHHHRELVGRLRADGCLGATRMRAVRNPVGMMRDRAELDPLAAHELARRIVEHLVRVHVAVVVGRRYRLGMEVVRTRAERAHDEAIPLEGLVHWRWLVHATDDGLEVVDVECPRIELTIPADDVERVMVERHLVDAVVLLHEDAELTHLVVGPELAGHANVALRVGRAFDELTELVAVALRRPNVPAALHQQQLRRIARPVEAVAMHDAAMDHEVVALPEREIAVLRLESALPLRDVHQLVRLGVAIVVLVVAIGLDVEHRDVLVEQEGDSIERGTSALLRACGEKVAMAEGRVVVRLELRLHQPLHRHHRRGRVHVVEERRGAGESFVADELLGVQSAIRLPEGDVPLPRDLPERVIERHGPSFYRFPRKACSRSIASNSALKLPAPKLRAPLRWMIS